MNTKTQAQSGFVYILSNESMPGLVKVGYTTNDPRKRAKELQTSGVPTPFKVEFALICDDAYEVEQDFHASFPESRVNGREFFRLSLDDAIIALFRRSGRDMEARLEDCVLDEGDHNRYSDMAGVHPFSLMMLLEQLKPEEWRNLAERDNHARLERAFK